MEFGVLHEECSELISQFFREKRAILSCSLDGTARLWSVAKGQCIREIQDPSEAEVYRCIFQPINNNLFVVSFLRVVEDVVSL